MEAKYVFWWTRRMRAHALPHVLSFIGANFNSVCFMDMWCWWLKEKEGEQEEEEKGETQWTSCPIRPELNCTKTGLLRFKNWKQNIIFPKGKVWFYHQRSFMSGRFDSQRRKCEHKRFFHEFLSSNRTDMPCRFVQLCVWVGKLQAKKDEGYRWRTTSANESSGQSHGSFYVDHQVV